MAGAGFTPDEIDQMPFDDVCALLAMWRSTPPAFETLAHVFVASPPPKDDADPSAIGDLMQRAPDGFLKAGM